MATANGSADGFVAAARVAANAVFSLSALVGVPGNLLVLFIIVRYREMQSVSNIFIFNLALADLCFLLTTPIVVAHALSSRWPFGLFVCKAFLTSNAINQFASSLIMGVLSFDRYLAVCRAIRSRRYRTPCKAVVLSLACWTLVSVEMSPVFLFGDLVELPWNSAGPQCVIRWRWGWHQPVAALNTSALNGSDDALARHWMMLYGEMRMSRKIFTTYSFCLSYLLPLACVWFFYIQIIVSLWRRRRQLFKMSHRRDRRTTVKVTIMGLAIVFSYTVCWLPFWFVQWSLELGAGWIEADGVLLPVSLSAYALQYINSALNPFLYVFFTDSFRQILRGRRERLRIQRMSIPTDYNCSVVLDNGPQSRAKRKARAQRSNSLDVQKTALIVTSPPTAALQTAAIVDQRLLRVQSQSSFSSSLNSFGGITPRPSPRGSFTTAAHCDGADASHV